MFLEFTHRHDIDRMSRKHILGYRVIETIVAEFDTGNSSGTNTNNDKEIE